MTKLIRALQTYLLFAFPFVLAIMLWGTLQPEKDIATAGSPLLYGVWNVLAWNLMAWFALLSLFLVLMVTVPEARERTLKRLANLRERDEREEYITGRASRSAYISTLSLLILLLFLSIFSLNIYRVPKEQAIDGKTGISSISLKFNLLDKPQAVTNSDNKMILDVSDIPLSKTAIILTLIIWQLVAFNLSARRENLRELGA